MNGWMNGWTAGCMCACLYVCMSAGLRVCRHLVCRPACMDVFVRSVSSTAAVQSRLTTCLHVCFYAHWLFIPQMCLRHASTLDMCIYPSPFFYVTMEFEHFIQTPRRVSWTATPANCAAESFSIHASILCQHLNNKSL